ncbi:MAG: ABC transporter ATP-binding protein [Nannocystaceae bacterium]|nr:ABC transporter ATP-binding protein [Nannocystaceae bacterium]
MHVRLSGLGKSYDGVAWAVRDLDLEIPSGSILGLIGPNGAGKTTALRMMATVLEPSRGTVAFDGVTPDGPEGQQALRRRIGFLGDGNPLYKDLTPREYLRFFGECFRMDPATLRDAIEETLATFALEPKADTPAGELSKGMRQRLLIARCLLHRPDLLILDEPADGLDPRGRSELRRILDGVRSRGATVVVSSHILRELDDLCDRVAILQQGTIVVAGPVGEIIERYEVGRLVFQLRVLSGVEAARAVIARHRALLEAEGELDGLPTLSVQIQASRVGDHASAASPTDPARAAEAAMAELLSDLVAAGVKVVTCNRLRSRLEDVYDRLSDDRVN